MRVDKRRRREAKHLFRLCLVNGVLDEHRVWHVVQRVVADSHRDGPAILSHFGRLVKLEVARHTATVESVTLLPDDLRAAIATGLTRRYGPGITTIFAERPALVGGVRIEVGSDVYDGSVRAGLAALEKSFKARNP